MNFVSTFDFAQCIARLDGIVKGVILRSVVNVPPTEEMQNNIGIRHARWLKNYPGDMRNAKVDLDPDAMPPDEKKPEICEPDDE